MKLKFGKRQGGFSLIELMVVVAIIGVLSSLAMPRFKRFQARAKQSEAKNNLSHIYTLQVAYQGENNSYGTEAQIGWKDPDNSRYACTAVGAVSTFDATCKAAAGVICSKADEWTMDETKQITAKVNCANED